MTHWSHKQEQRLRELEQERSILAAARSKAVQNLEELLNRCWSTSEDRVTAELLILHADAMRDALAPFDSGVRSQGT